jgi:hypothetical protein
MRVSAYLYPWDVARAGAEQVVDDLVELGIEAVHLAATYHPIDALTPRNGGSFFTSPRGAVHFPARPERYGRITPSRSAPVVCAAWPEISERAHARGIAINAWTVTLFQPWIIDAHPDCARVLPTGDPIGSGVCPANDDVRAYLSELCADVVDQFGVELVHLESIMPLGYDIDWLRPRVLVDVPRQTRELLTICFCPTCTQRGAGAGIDVEQLRQRVMAAVGAALNDGDEGPGRDLGDDASLQAFLSQHEQASIELAAGVSARLEGSPAKVGATIRTPFPSMRGGVADELMAQLAEVVDQLAVAAGGGAKNQKIAAIAATAPREIELGMMISRGLRFPGIASADEKGDDPLPGQLREAAELGVDEIGLYNYGLLPDAEVRRFMDAVREARS